MLSLEPIPVISADMDKGKWIVFGYEKKSTNKEADGSQCHGEELLYGAIKSGLANSRLPLIDGPHSDGIFSSLNTGFSSYYDSPTAYRVGFSEASSSGKSKRKNKPRKRPHISKRNLKGPEADCQTVTVGLKGGDQVGKVIKRKADREVSGSDHQA